MRALLSSLLVVALLPACSTPEAPAPAPSAITSGAAFDGLYVVQVTNLTLGGTVGGVLVGRRAVLTRAALGSATDSFQVTFGADQSAPTATILSVHFTPSPDFGTAMLGRDVGIVELASDAPGSITPVPLSFTTPAVGTAITLAGFGTTSATAMDSGHLRSGTTMLASTTGAMWQTAATGSLGCHQDIAGAVLLGAPGSYQLVGMLGASDATCALPSNVIPLAPEQAWAMPALTEIATRTGSPDAGTSADAGSGTDAGTTTSGGGCCRIGGASGGAAPGSAVAALAVLVVVSRRRRA